MAKLRFVKISPGGNPTILLEAGQVAAPRRAAVASSLMRPLSLGAEQVGFMECRSAPPSLEMMGGEFCLNAIRALAYELWRRGIFFPLQGTEDLYGLVRSSGLEEPVQVRVRAGRGGNAEDAPRECFVSLSLPWEETRARNRGEGTVLVRLPGIVHLLVEEDPGGEDLFRAGLAWMERFGLLEEEACGVIWHQPWDIPEEEEAAARRAGLPAPVGRAVTPLVRVAGTGSLVAESSCGSGSLALALALAPGEGDFGLLALQPGGEFLRLGLAARRPGDALRRAEVGGQVRFIAEGVCYG